MANWLNITDAQLTEYRPYLARWVKGVRDNLVGVAQRYVLAHGPAQGGPTGAIAGTSFPGGSNLLRIYIPAFCVGTGGTSISMDGTVSTEIGYTYYGRLLVGGDVGGTGQALGGGSGGDKPLGVSLTWTPTPDDYVWIEFEGYHDVGASDTSWIFGSPVTGEGVLTIRRVDA